MLEAQAEARADLAEAHYERRAALQEAQADLAEAHYERRAALQEAAADVEEIAAEEQEGESKMSCSLFTYFVL